LRVASEPRAGARRCAWHARRQPPTRCPSQPSQVDLEPFGRTLLIDGLIQSCQCDEFVYHECLVHPALLAHPNPKSIFIGGGGEGSTARECLRHKTVERVVMVDIDEAVVAFCKEHLPENTAAFADKRLELVIDDAKVCTC